MSASKVRETPNGVKYVDIAKGEGLTPKQGDFVVITYTGCKCVCVAWGVGSCMYDSGSPYHVIKQPKNRPARRDHLRQPARQGQKTAGIQDRDQAGSWADAYYGLYWWRG